MALTTRLMLLLLGTLALVLGGFSATLYLLADRYLHRQVEERLGGMVDRLVAGAEFGPGGVEWEPQQRTLPSVSPDVPVVWQVLDERGHIIDQLGGGESGGLLAQAIEEVRTVYWQEQNWLVQERVVQSAVQKPGTEKNMYAVLRMRAGLSLDPMETTLRWLVGMLIVVSATIWLLALVVGRALCRRALLPVRDMAQAARDMSVLQPEERLPLPGTGDELQELARAFNELLDRLQTAFERQGRFTSDASHQLRTPLAALLGQVEVVLRRPRSTQEYQQTLRTVHRRASQLREIVEALLYLARSDAEANLPGTQELDLGGWLKERVDTWAQHDRARDLIIEDVPQALPVRAHPVLLGELLNILLENACKYSEAGTPIAVRTHREDGCVILAIEDRGCGIAAEELPHVWQPFFRSYQARLRGVAGVGLGLAIAQRLAVSFGGRLTVRSQLGCGSTFSLWLPALPAAEQMSAVTPADVMVREKFPV